MIKFLKISGIIILSLLLIALAGLFTFFAITKNAVLDENKLINPNQNILIYDENGNEIVNASLSGKNKSVNIEDLSKDTLNAFIASEDRTFYSHNGLNYKRMLKALYKNITTKSFKEGASTISQQLIKNTHLSQKKTIKRKLNEIKLTKQLEKRYKKDEILEMYLNTIYFGHSCYGLESAAEFYFDKQADELSLDESATLVGLLSSPNNYSPFKNPEKSLNRRNIVLKAMLDCGYIGDATYEKSVVMPINTKQRNTSDKYSDYLNGIFDELEVTDLSYYDLKSGSKIYTFMNSELQSLIENFDFECDNSIVITSENGGVNAYKSTINGARRQPGSTIKPFLVYAPAIEEKKLNTFTKILDEKVDFNGYSPENHDKKYHGYVSVAESLAKSYNVPAVKTLNALTLDAAQKYLTRMNIALEDSEKNLALALGGMKHGLSLKDITDRYAIFQNGGIYNPSRFIKKIVAKNGKTVYEAESFGSRVFSEGTCSLMNEMLKETSKSGTAKKLKNFKFDVASKTGTCGTIEGNTDAYAVGYTSEHCVGVWLGDKDNKRLSVTGGNDCCNYLKQILSEIYSSHTPKNLETSKGTSTVEIDAEEYFDNNKIIIADALSPKLNKLNVKVLSGNEPKELSTRFSSPIIVAPSISVQNGTVCIELCQTKYYGYSIKRTFENKNEIIYDGIWKKIVSDEPPEGTYVYTVIPYFDNGENKIYGQEVTLPAVNLTKNGTSPQVKIPDITKKNWYDL